MKKLITTLLVVIVSIISYSQNNLPIKNTASGYSLYSPDKNISIQFQVQNNRLYYQVYHRNSLVIYPSALAIVVNDIYRGNIAKLTVSSATTINETYASRGVHSIAINHCNTAFVHAQEANNANVFTIEVKVFNDGIAFRYLLSTTGDNTVNADSTTFTLPQNSVIWRQQDINSYEGVYKKQLIEDVPNNLKAGPPITALTNNDSSYIVITEAVNSGFAGMSLQYSGNNTFKAILKGITTINGAVQTPWRVVVVGKDLNTLVNTDIIQNLSPRMDQALFPDGFNTSWIKPGKSVWSWLSENDGGLFGVSFPNMMRYSKLASALGFEYNLVDEGWAYWSEGGKDNWTLLKELVDSSAKWNVQIWVWKSYVARLGVAGIQDSAARWEFFSKCKEAGVAGLKIDFFPDEKQSVLKWYNDALRDAAKLQLMINFHGTNKPTGQNFTWPNEMTREGIRGLENPSTDWLNHNTILPFTRFVAGHGDYTPFSLNPSLTTGTTVAHQLATLITFTSPLMCVGANPDSLLANPLKEIVRNVPTEWDETIVLPQSKIGVISLFARRKGNIWYLAALNGETENTVELSMDMLPKEMKLSSSSISVLAVKDDPLSSAKVNIHKITVKTGQTYKVKLQPGGGFVATTNLTH